MFSFDKFLTNWWGVLLEGITLTWEIFDKYSKSFKILFCVSILNLKYLLEPPMIKLIVLVFSLFKSKLILWSASNVEILFGFLSWSCSGEIIRSKKLWFDFLESTLSKCY